MIKKILSLFIILIFISSTTANAFSFKRETQTDKIIKEGLGNSIIEGEYPDAINVEPIIKEDERKKDLLIEGGVEKYLDVTLNDCLKLALGNNPKIKAAINDSLASHARITQKWSNYFPSFSWSTGYNKIRQLQLSDALGENLIFNYYVLGEISLSQMVYDFGKTQNEVTIQKIEYESYQQQLVSIINEVIYNTKDSYYGLLYALDYKRVAQDTVDKFQLFYDQAKALYEIGLNPKVDVTIAEVNLSSAKLKLIQSDNMVDIAMAKLNNVMGIPCDIKYNIIERLTYNPINMKISEAFEIAKDSRPDLKKAELQVKYAQEGVKLAKKAYFPKLEASASYTIGGRTFTSNYGYTYGLYLNFPTINGLKIKSQIDEAKALYDSQIANSQASKNDIYYEIQDAYLKLLEKRMQMPVSFLQVKQAKENYELSAGRYRVGEASPIELKDAQISYETAQLNYYQSLYNFNSARAALEKAIGKNIITEEDTEIDFE